MWYLEHFNYTGIADTGPVIRKSSFSNIIHNGDIVPDITVDVQHHFDSTEMLKHVHIPDNLKVTSLYGKAGMTLTDAMSDTRANIILEMPARWLGLIPDPELAHIVNTHHLLITDFEDGGMIYNNGLIKRLIQLRIVPKKTILHATSSTQLNDVPSLNMKHMYVPYWLFFNSAFAHAKYADKLDQHVSFIQNSTYSKQLLFLNLKPRLYRTKLLLRLWKAGILDHASVDWSWINGKPYKTDPNSGTQTAAPAHASSEGPGVPELISTMVSKLTSEEQNLWEQIQQAYTFPKFHSTISNSDQLLNSAPSDFAVYNWSLAVETHYGNEFPLTNKLGTASFMTEKTFKSFMQASMPLTLCEGDTYNQLNQLGFKVDNQYLDCYTNPEDRLNETVKLIQNILDSNMAPDRQNIIHNFERIVDIRSTAQVFNDCLINILKSLTHSK